MFEHRAQWAESSTSQCSTWGILLPETILSADSLTVFVQPLCAIAFSFINICVHVKDPEHWLTYHYLDAWKCSTQKVSSWHQIVAAQVAGELKTFTPTVHLLENWCTILTKRRTQKKQKEWQKSRYFVLNSVWLELVQAENPGNGLQRDLSQ